MKFLVIGSQGFIGSHCYSYFSGKGFHTFGADIVEVPLLPQENYIILHALDPDYEQLFATDSYDVCINASGSANVGFSFSNPSKDFELNVGNVRKMLLALRKYSPACKFVNFSSAAVYGNPLKLPVSEADRLTPLSPYGNHKLESETLLKQFEQEDGLQTCSLRVFSAYGPGLRKQLFWDLYQKAISQEVVELFGTGKESRDFIYIDDLTNAVEQVIKKGAFKGEAINLASGDERRIEDVATLLLSFINPVKKIVFNGRQKQGDPLYWKADISKLRSLGFNPQVSIENGIKKYVSWLREESELG